MTILHLETRVTRTRMACGPWWGVRERKSRRETTAFDAPHTYLAVKSEYGYEDATNDVKKGATLVCSRKMRVVKVYLQGCSNLVLHV